MTLIRHVSRHSAKVLNLKDICLRLGHGTAWTWYGMVPV